MDLVIVGLMGLLSGAVIFKIGRYDEKEEVMVIGGMMGTVGVALLIVWMLQSPQEPTESTKPIQELQQQIVTAKVELMVLEHEYTKRTTFDCKQVSKGLAICTNENTKCYKDLIDNKYVSCSEYTPQSDEKIKEIPKVIKPETLKSFNIGTSGEKQHTGDWWCDHHYGSKCLDTTQYKCDQLIRPYTTLVCGLY